MQQSRTRRLAPIILIFCSFSISVAAVVWWYVEHKITAALTSIDAAVSLLETDMEITLAHLERNSASDAISGVVQDCASDERQQFDSLLDELDSGLTTSELTRLQSLYYRCADFYAIQRAVLANRLSHQVEYYSTLTSLAASLRGDDQTQNKISLWQTIAAKQTEISAHFARLVAIQGDIIAALLSGERRDSEVIRALLNDAQATQESIGVLTVEIANTQASLNDV